MRLRAAWASTRNPDSEKEHQVFKKGEPTVIGSYQKGRQLWMSETAGEILIPAAT